jgi:AraC-like DNA-binding protein
VRADDWRSAGEPLERLTIDAPPRTWDEARVLLDEAIARLVPAETRSIVVHPAIIRARAWLTLHLDEDDLSLERVAREAGLSGGRLSHLWSEHLGLGFRPFILWLRLQRAARELASGESLTSAAAAAGFADGAHMARTFRRMFGLAPSDVVGLADWVLPPVPQ